MYENEASMGSAMLPMTGAAGVGIVVFNRMSFLSSLIFIALALLICGIILLVMGHRSAVEADHPDPATTYPEPPHVNSQL